MIDAYASAPHYAAHLRPVFDALPASHRGTFYTDRPPNRGGPIMVASIGCYQATSRRPVVLFEHGHGQTYADPNPAYAGGTGRERVVLFLNPNDHTSEANRSAYPGIPSVTCGIPYVDAWAHHKPTGGKVVAFSWHWRNRSARPVGAGDSAWPHYRDTFPAQIDRLRSDGWTILGTAHPRAMRRMQTDTNASVDLRNWYGTLGVEVVDDLADVLNRASVFVADTTSASWLAAAAGLGVVLLDSPAYQRAYDLRLWPRFDPKANAIGLRVRDPNVLASAVAHTHTILPHRDIGAALDLVVPHRDGTAAARAAAAIVEHVRL